jgi:CubicO group peptidase (beta-lactamase class C family)
MRIPFADALRAGLDDLIQRAAERCCLRKIPALGIARSLPLDVKIARAASWLDELGRRRVFNGTVLLARQGRVLLEKSHGFADVSGLVPLSGDSSFSLASVSKQFTATGIMILAQRGKLGLRDGLERHIPELAHYRDVTITHLLQHTSGLPDYMSLADDYWDPEVVLTEKGVIALLQQHRPPPYFAPGESFDYSNTGYALLGEVIARASGAPYPEFMAAHIFGPLGMQDSAAFNLASKTCPLRSRVYGFRRRFGCFGKRVSHDLNYLDGVYGDGGIYASARDLFRWDAGLREGKLVPCDFYEQAYAPGRLNDGEATSYGFGWEIRPPGTVEHMGEWEGFTTCLSRDLEKQTLLVVLSNQAPSACVDEICLALGGVLEDL